MKIFTGTEFTSYCSSVRRILLINAPATDIRLPWSKWQQPIGLLKIGTWLRDGGKDIRFIDCLQVSQSKRLTRKKVGQVAVEGYQINLWRFGLSASKIVSRLDQWIKQDWKPDVVLISCGMSFWWLGARDLIRQLKQTIQAPIILGGPYPTFYSEHAAIHSGADFLFVGDVPEAASVVPDLDLYGPGSLPHFAGIHLLYPTGVLESSASARDPKQVADEVQIKASQGVTAFAFYDPWFGPEHRSLLTNVLAEIASRRIPKIWFVAPGNFSPRLINESLAAHLKKVRFRHIYLHDDILHKPNEIQYLSGLDDYQECMNAFHSAGFRPRTDEIGAAVMIGLPREDVDALTKRLVQISSLVGSVHLVPFQFTHGTDEGKPYEHWFAQRNGDFDLTNINGRSFPLIRMADANYDDYLEIIRLVALLNSKYRNQSFDFLGSGLTAQLVRESLRCQLWNPFRDSEVSEKHEREKFILLPIKEEK